MIDDLIESFNSAENNRWRRLPELHISLSKTFPVRFHHIESIRKSLQQELSQSMIKYVSPKPIETKTSLGLYLGSPVGSNT